jgi:hypothetical protein
VFDVEFVWIVFDVELVGDDLVAFTPFVADDVLLELSAKEAEKAYCGKIKIAESKMGIKNFVFTPSHHPCGVNKKLRHLVH